MKPITFLIPIILTQTTLADITHIEDNRSFNSILGLHGGQGVPSVDDSTIVEYNNFNQNLFDSFSNTISDPIIGIASTSLEFESSISQNQFYSNATASASATTLPGGSIASANTAFVNSVYFTVDETTTFHINGFISGTDSFAGQSIVNFSSRNGDGNYIDTIFELYSNEQTLSINTTIELEAGHYSFFALTYASTHALAPNESLSATASHDITVTVIPTPASSALILLAGSTILTCRRR